jgi:hypothetical protein
MKYKGNDTIIPSQETKSIWLTTRKSADNTTFAGLQFPGLFNLPITDFHLDRKMFWIAVVLEIFFIVIVRFKIGSFNPKIMGIVFALVILDFIAAFFLHTKQKEITKTKVSIRIKEYLRYHIKGTNVIDADIIQLTERLRSFEKNTWRIAGLWLLILVAVIKIVGSLAFRDYGLVAFVTIAYIFVAYIHYKHTGYFFSAVLFYRSLKSDYSNALTLNPEQKENKSDNYNTINIDMYGYRQPDDWHSIQHKIFPNLDIHDKLLISNKKDSQTGKDVTQLNLEYYKHRFWSDDDLKTMVKSVGFIPNGDLRPLPNDQQGILACCIIEKIMLSSLENNTSENIAG